MTNTLKKNIQAFVDIRLEHADAELKENSDYKHEIDKIDMSSQQLREVLSPEQAVTLGDIEDSYLKIINLYESMCYRLGFIDALQLAAEL